MTRMEGRKWSFALYFESACLPLHFLCAGIHLYYIVLYTKALCTCVQLCHPLRTSLDVLHVCLIAVTISVRSVRLAR